ncbi:zinc finger protein 33A-like [Phlebotomus papatasi]|uniref:zinc finger protein 33A-like n=1 Tax=Phlebotomus papatasi TaxID=29031 RepID=UPI002484624C|nr:zinc finger protein 33A-like [Phlebotomus papatasi]
MGENSENSAIDPNICRICEGSKYLIDILATENQQLYKKLSELEAVQDDKDYEMFHTVYKFVCTRCENSIEGWYDFKTKCISTRKKLMKNLEKAKTDLTNEASLNIPPDPLSPTNRISPIPSSEPIDHNYSARMKSEDDNEDKYFEDEHREEFVEYPEAQDISDTRKIADQTSTETYSINVDENDRYLGEEHRENVFVEVEPQHIVEDFSSSTGACPERVTPVMPVTQNLKKFPCTECNRSFNKKISFDRHRVTHQTYKNLCIRCEQTFDDRTTLIKHVLSAHENLKKYYCKNCNKIFASLDSLNTHMETHELTPKFSCPICKSTFVRVRRLEEHILKFHTQAVSDLNSQISTFVKKPNEPAELAESDKRLKMCYKCGELYVRKKFRKVGSNEEITCAICLEAFATMDKLKEHMISHMADKRYKCPGCPKSFTEKRKWKMHLETHFGNKKFKCGNCEYGFTRKFQLEEHLRDFHRNPPIAESSEKEVVTIVTQLTEAVGTVGTIEEMDVDEDIIEEIIEDPN